MTNADLGDDVDEYEYRSTKRTRADMAAQFAAVLLLVTAAFEVLQGISALADDELLVGGSDYAYRLDPTARGWIHVIIGVLLIAVAVGILARRSWAQVTGMIVAGSSMLANFAFLPIYPFWSLTVIAFNVVIVWALCTLLGPPE
jgi:hypothetical protein